jgi:acetyl-CoA C-acetyltransferase
MNAQLMQRYMDTYDVPAEVFNGFTLNAHHNARTNPYALFKDMEVTDELVSRSRVVVPPLRLFDAAPVCDGAAAVVLTRSSEARAYTDQPVKILGSAVATDWFRVSDRSDPLHLYAAARAAHKSFRKANVHRNDVDLFEVHDAFSIMACLALEAVGFAEPGQGWRLAAEGAIARDGRLPLATMGGLKARGHPVGATAVYQTCEIVQQLMGRAGPNQIPDARLAMLLSIGGAASTALTHLFGVQ